MIHRVIMNCPNDLCVDHINGNTLDNRKKNLRIATRSQNSMNMKPRGRSIYKGVFFESRCGKWRSVISVGGIKKSLGYFKKEEDAAIAYNKAAIDIHKEFSKLNIVNQELRNV